MTKLLFDQKEIYLLLVKYKLQKLKLIKNSD